ncbi:MAG: hypothetical protein ABIL01_16825 [Pseudomonadota bacterium]
MNTLVALPIAAAVPTTAPAMPGLAVAPAAPHPDAALFALIEQFVAADRKYRELRKTVDRIEDDMAGFRKRKELPDVLRWRKSDLKLGLPALHVCEAIPKPNWQAPIYVDQLRDKKWSRWARVVIKGHPIKGMFYNKCTLYTPSKAARARADEIIFAYDEWANPSPNSPPRGFKKLQKEEARADRAATKLENEVWKTRATTIDGMVAKVRAAHTSLFCKPDEIFDTGLDDLSGCAETMADSIFRDLQKLALAEAPLVPTGPA